MNTFIYRLVFVTAILTLSPLAVGQDKDSANSTDATFTKSTRTTDDVEQTKPFSNAYFSSVSRLMVGEKPLNTSASQQYPSPAMFDVDGDGRDELIVGCIYGTLNIYQNENEGTGEPIWSDYESLKSAKGNKIKVSNW